MLKDSVCIELNHLQTMCAHSVDDLEIAVFMIRPCREILRLELDHLEIDMYCVTLQLENLPCSSFFFQTVTSPFHFQNRRKDKQKKALQTKRTDKNIEYLPDQKYT